MMRCVPLELAAEKVCDQSSIPPLIFELPPDQGRLVLEKAQDTPVYTYSARTSKVLMNLGNLGRIN
ncbi:MAG TPA: lipase, partial [Lachnospiraceae bacterium]|nr:lipase [Lachnospiraceae bacterium]